MKPLAHSNRLPLAAALMLAATAGCGRDSVKVYHVENSDIVTSPPASTAAAMPATMPGELPVPDNSGQPKLKYTLPDGWKEKPLTQMRVASFEVSQNGKTDDVSVIPLAGMAGGDFANVNRWRGQVGLPPLAEADLQKLAEKVEVAGQPADLYDVAGTTPGGGDAERIVGVILHRDDMAWFFKMTGDAALVENQKRAFVAFLKSVEFVNSAAPAAPTAMDMSQLPPSHPPIDGMSLGNQNSLVPNANTTMTGGMNSNNNDKPIWTIPPDWKQIDSGAMLLAKFSIASGNGDAGVNVSSLAGDGGGLAANVNRWRGQLGLQPIVDILTSSIDVAGGKAQVVDFTGTDSKTSKPARLIGAIVPQNGQTWFYKLMGDEQIVAQQKDAFTKFIQSANYANAR